MTMAGEDERKGGTSRHEADSEPLHVPVARERLVVRKTEVEQVAARVTLRTRSMDVPVSETLRRERVEVERVPVDRIVAEPPVARVEDGVTIIPVVEEVLVRQFRIVEEVRIVPHAETIEHAETVTLRRQEAVVEEPVTTDAPAGRTT